MAFALVQEVLPKVSSIDNPEPGAVCIVPPFSLFER